MRIPFITARTVTAVPAASPIQMTARPVSAFPAVPLDRPVPLLVRRLVAGAVVAMTCTATNPRRHGAAVPRRPAIRAGRQPAGPCGGPPPPCRE